MLRPLDRVQRYSSLMNKGLLYHLTREFRVFSSFPKIFMKMQKVAALLFVLLTGLLFNGCGAKTAGNYMGSVSMPYGNSTAEISDAGKTQKKKLFASSVRRKQRKLSPSHLFATITAVILKASLVSQNFIVRTNRKLTKNHSPH